MGNTEAMKKGCLSLMLSFRGTQCPEESLKIRRRFFCLLRSFRKTIKMPIHRPELCGFTQYKFCEEMTKSLKTALS